MADRLIKGILVVVIGVILLMNTTGNLPWSVWDAAIAYWPILIIGLGIQIAFSKWRIPGLALAMIAILILSYLYPYPSGNLLFRNTRFQPMFQEVQPPVKTYTKELKVPVDEEKLFLEMWLTSPALDLRASGDPSLNTGTTRFAVKGGLSWDVYEPLVDSSLDQGGEKLQVSVRSPRQEGTGAGRQSWDLRVNPAFSSVVQVTGGAADLDFDLESFFVEQLTVSAGVTSAEIRCGSWDKESNISLTGGVVNAKFVVPEDVGIKLSVSGPPLVTRVSLAGLNLTKQGTNWISEGYEDAPAKINIEVSCGAGKVALVKAK